MSIRLQTNKEPIIITNLYNTPASQIPLLIGTKTTSAVPFKNELTLGDLNARHQRWHKIKNDDRGNEIAESILSGEANVLNDRRPMRKKVRLSSHCVNQKGKCRANGRRARQLAFNNYNKPSAKVNPAERNKRQLTWDETSRTSRTLWTNNLRITKRVGKHCKVETPHSR